MSAAFVGIDPGKTGGIAVITNDSAEAWLYPGEIAEATKLLNQLAAKYDIQFAALEKVNAMPKQGVSSTFKFGTNFGAWQGALSALEIPYLLVVPRNWQKVMLDAGTGETKQRSLSMARRMFPGVDLSLKKHDGKADALHLARWARWYLEGQGWMEVGA